VGQGWGGGTTAREHGGTFWWWCRLDNGFFATEKRHYECLGGCLFDLAVSVEKKFE
jgi:hypothetical protein